MNYRGWKAEELIAAEAKSACKDFFHKSKSGEKHLESSVTF